MAGTWYLPSKWYRWLPAAILFKLYQKKYDVAILYEDSKNSFVMKSKDPFWKESQ